MRRRLWASIAGSIERGLRPGADLAVIGLRDEAVIRYMTPSLTCFELSLFDTGAALAEAILGQLAPEHDTRRPTQVKMPMRIRPGESDPPLSDGVAKATGKRTKPPVLALPATDR